jgi:hypothetical protein
MAERSVASSAACVAGLAAWVRASSRMLTLDGDRTSAAALGAKEKPVMTPPALRLTSAVACCHHGFLAGWLMRSPPS